MGVSGSGKTSVGAALARAWGFEFVDGDDLHPPANIEKMRGGIPLTDEDRWPWLEKVGAVMCSALMGGGGIVVACSALRRAYRNRLRLATGEAIRFIYLAVSREVIADRLASRSGHFMPASLIDTQFATLERPGIDESDAITVVADGPVARVVDAIVAACRRAT